ACGCGLGDHLAGDPRGVARGDLGEHRVRSLLHGPPALAHDRGAARDRLPTAHVPAAAPLSVGLDDDVPDLTGEAVLSSEEAAADDDPSTDARPDTDEHHMLASLRGS